MVRLLSSHKCLKCQKQIRAHPKEQSANRPKLPLNALIGSKCTRRCPSTMHIDQIKAILTLYLQLITTLSIWFSQFSEEGVPLEYNVVLILGRI